jgi:hypothetical protein
MMLVLFSRILLLYANFTPTILNYTTSCQSVHDLSEAIERLSAWNKCFVLAVKNPKIYYFEHTYMLANSCLSHVTVDTSLKSDKHVSLITYKALVCSRLILKCFHFRDHLLLVKAFRTYVRPSAVEYCSAVWSPHYHYLIDKSEGVQRCFY